MRMPIGRASANTVMMRATRVVIALAWICLLVSPVTSPAGSALADDYADTVGLFKQAGASAGFFAASYAYVVFPTIMKGGFFVGGARDKGRVYERGRDVAESTMTQVSLGFQLGGQAYSAVVFLKTRQDLSLRATGLGTTRAADRPGD
jgi:lipid-binding SYLF domain-containing protein